MLLLLLLRLLLCCLTVRLSAVLNFCQNWVEATCLVACWMTKHACCEHVELLAQCTLEALLQACGIPAGVCLSVCRWTHKGAQICR